MPQYEFFCETCKKEQTISMTIGEHDKGGARCPECGNRGLTPLVGSFFSKTSRKS
jgi:putative FmdB family regulatory protein